MPEYKHEWHDTLWCPACRLQAKVTSLHGSVAPRARYYLDCGCTLEVVSPVVPKPEPEGLPTLPCPWCGGRVRESIRCNATFPADALPWSRYKLVCGHEVEVRAV